MGYIRKTPSGSYRACWRDATGRQPSKSLITKREAAAFLAEIESNSHRGTYVDPHAGRRVPFDSYARRWLEDQSYELTGMARDQSNMRNHLVSYWKSTPLSKIGHSDIQKWVTHLGRKLAPATVAQCFCLVSGVMSRAIRDRLMSVNPSEGVRLPEAREQADTGQFISQTEFWRVLLPVVPVRHQALITLAACSGLRWGECIGLRWSSIRADDGWLRVERVAIEINGNVSTKPYPKSRAGRRTVPLPPHAVTALQRYREAHGQGPSGEVFVNEAGGPIRRSLFRSRICRPSLVHAGMLGRVEPTGDRQFIAHWIDEQPRERQQTFTTQAQAITHLARHGGPALRFHDLRHSYATWFQAGATVNDVQRVMGHQQASTTLAIYTHVSEGLNGRVLDALAAFPLPSEKDEDPETGQNDEPEDSDQQNEVVGDTGIEPVHAQARDQGKLASDLHERVLEPMHR